MKMQAKDTRQGGKYIDMRAAICDDQPEALEELKKLLLQIPAVKKVYAYSYIGAFWAALESGEYYDVVFMDIDWNQEQTGIDFAERLAELCPYTRLIYVTAHTMDYVEDIFLRHSNLGGFLQKPVKREVLLRSLEKLRAEQSADSGKLLIYCQGSHIAIPFRDIRYLESRLHKTCVVLERQEYLCNEKMEALKEQLDGRFLNCHKSYMVNMEYIREFHGRELILEDGRVIPVSKARGKASKERFFSYVSGKM